jgi:sedoheptulokinase
MDFATLKLTEGPAGRRPVTDATIAASVGLADPYSGQPDPRALQEAEFGSVLPASIREAGSRVGSTAGGAGIPSGAPVFAPLGDNQAGFLGAVRDVEGMGLLNVGTGGQISAWLPSVSEAELREAERPRGYHGRARIGLARFELEVRPFPGGGVLLVGATLCAGQAYALLEGFFREVLETFGARAEGPLYARMNELAAGPEDPLEDPLKEFKDGLRVNTRFNGARHDPEATGAIHNIKLRNLTPAALVRGFLEGIASELHGPFEAMSRFRGAPLRGLAGSGNGLRRNPALRGMLAQYFGQRLLVPRLPEEAALGAALAAAVGLGAYPGFRAAGGIIAYEGEEAAHG